MKAPIYLTHKPIIEAADYDKIDAQYAKKTDVVALSIGNAQYDEKEISLKIWRRTGKKFSRQSEELPIHRGLDLALLFVGALLFDSQSNRPVTTLGESEVEHRNVNDIKAYYEDNKTFLEPRLKELRDKLNEFLPQKKI